MEAGLGINAGPGKRPILGCDEVQQVLITIRRQGPAYLSAALDQRREVVFRHFQSAFHTWLLQECETSEAF
ncbi:uncharacterized protein LY79DRAFT_574302, partial [Colletotrichum navitas]